MAQKISLLFIGAVFLCLLITGTGHADEKILVIVNCNLPFNSLTRETISNIYKAEETKWENGETIIVVMHKRGPIHDKFSQKIVGITPYRLRDIWRNVIFTGLGKPPRIFRDEEALVSYIAKTKNSIGYINAATPHKGVKVISIID